MVKEFLYEKCAKKSEQISPIRIYKYPRSIKRDDLAVWFKEWGFTKGVEVGVREGEFSEILCKANPNLHIKCVDPWNVKDYRSNLIGARQQEDYYNTCVSRMSKYNSEIIRKTSMEAVSMFEDESLDFVYIDGSHEFDDIMRDVIEWSNKVKPDGIIACHDYYRFKRAGVVEAIDLYTHMHGVSEWYLTDDKTPTAFWAKHYRW